MLPSTITKTSITKMRTAGMSPASFKIQAGHIGHVDGAVDSDVMELSRVLVAMSVVVSFITV
jgi:hypothetical protein